MLEAMFLSYPTMCINGADEFIVQNNAIIDFNKTLSLSFSSLLDVHMATGSIIQMIQNETNWPFSGKISVDLEYTIFFCGGQITK